MSEIIDLNMFTYKEFKIKVRDEEINIKMIPAVVEYQVMTFDSSKLTNFKEIGKEDLEEYKEMVKCVVRENGYNKDEIFDKLTPLEIITVMIKIIKVIDERSQALSVILELDKQGNGKKKATK